MRCAVVTAKHEHLYPGVPEAYRKQHWPRAPNEQELHAFAPQLGLDPAKHSHLLHLAEAALVS
jgi:hypothetical protein